MELFSKPKISNILFIILYYIYYILFNVGILCIDNVSIEITLIQRT